MATRPERRPRGQDRRGAAHDAALSFSFGIGTEATNRHDPFECTVHLISRPRSLHFTLNHYTMLVRAHWIEVTKRTSRKRKTKNQVGIPGPPAAAIHVESVDFSKRYPAHSDRPKTSRNSASRCPTPCPWACQLIRSIS